MKHYSLVAFIPLALMFAFESPSFGYSSPFAEHEQKVNQALDAVESIGPSTSSNSSNDLPSPIVAAPSKHRAVSSNAKIESAPWNSSAVAKEVNNFIKHKVHEFDMGTEISHITYKEPSATVREKGGMYGVYGVYTYRPGKDDIFDNSLVTMYRIDAKLSFGQMDYSSDPSGTLNGIPDYLFELRTVAGYDWYTTPDWLLTPYAGLGYRRLSDDSGGMMSSTGASGYGRIANYFYFPLGMDISHQLTPDWRVGGNGEFDVLFWGHQESHLSDVSVAEPDLNNKQQRGYGLRGSLKVQKIGEKYNFSLEPFVRYWHIAQSDVNIAVGPGGVIEAGYEPDNNSTEVGVKAGFQF
jgi:hypothetical protein